MIDTIEQHLREIKGEIGSRSFGELGYLFLIDVLDVYLTDMPKVLKALRVQNEALKYYENVKRLMIEVRDVPKHLVSQNFKDDGDTARQALTKAECILMGESKE